MVEVCWQQGMQVNLELAGYLPHLCNNSCANACSLLSMTLAIYVPV
jgi:hypothetical protein